ncbi:MAG TPA: hypothetical protein VFW87_03840 [Pirellulales bacterium]|nr:hypothetical protein [Pirellulales bacterium]
MSAMLSDPDLRSMLRGVRGLHRLALEGKDDDCPEAEAIRDATDAPWQALSEADRQLVRELSEDLYSLTDPAPGPRPTTPEVVATLDAIAEARKRGDWQQALILLRRGAEYLAPEQLSYLRGVVWQDAGDPETAAIFLEHAARLAPDSGALKLTNVRIAEIMDEEDVAQYRDYFGRSAP